jgi:hypothetical protein
MTRVVSVGRSKGLWAAGALGFTLLMLSLAGCPGTLDPTLFMSGTAGTSGAAGTGAAGTGTAGTTGAGGAVACDMVTLITMPANPMMPAKGGYGCTLAGACHDAVGSAAGLSLMQADWPKLKGAMPMVKTPAPAFPSICATDATAKTMPYIIAGSATGDGLLMKKLMGPVCPPGVQMPSLGGPIKAADLPCFQQWATMLANM